MNKRLLGRFPFADASSKNGSERRMRKFHIRNICKRVWRGEGWVEEWREGVVVPMLEKGSGKKVEDYRGITLT